MTPITIPQITKTLEKLPAEKLIVVYDFVQYLAERDLKPVLHEPHDVTYELLLASEHALAQDWNKSEEDVAWANL